MKRRVAAGYIGFISAAGIFAMTTPIATASTNNVTYTVQSGDTLYKISQKYNVTVSSLATLNHIANPNAIYVGEALTLPLVQYTVITGDTLGKIAKTFGATVASIQTQNHIANPNMIYVGQVLRIPQPSTPAPSTPAPSTPAPSTPAPSTPANLGAKVVATAESYLGPHPYVWGGNTPAGWDCSGFTSYVFAQNGISLPRASKDQATVGTSVAESLLLPGDLVFFSGTTTSTAGTNIVSHVGIYVGNGSFIYESSSKNAVMTATLSNPYWAAHYWGARRVQ